MTLRIAVYTISLNEEQHIDRWVNSVVDDADCLVIADTGSTDNTVALLEQRGVSVYRIKVDPWRFDDARNTALALIPADIDVCISMDMDEYMSANWRRELENSWSINVTTRMSYTYVFDADSGFSFYADKIHARRGYRWRRPVHETVFAVDGRETLSTSNNLVMYQKQDTEKSRKSYLPLLQLSHNENPTDSQTLFWLAREQMYNGLWADAREGFKRYLALESSTWDVERSEAMRMLAKVSSIKTETWLLKAMTECNYRREIWADLAEYYYAHQQWANCYWAAANGTSSTCRQSGTYLDDPVVWGSKIYDLGSIACYWLGLKAQGLDWVQNAIAINPNDQRLRSNQILLQELP